MPAVLEKLFVQVPSDLKNWIDQKAESEGRTIKSVVCRILEAQRKREQAHTTNREALPYGPRDN